MAVTSIVGRIDPLTGVLRSRNGRLHLKEVFPGLDAPRAGMALLVIDLVKFIYVNDHWGHTHGDGMLRRVATAISDLAGERPVWRSGGDEFMVLTTGGAGEALRLARAIRASVRAMGDGAPGRPLDVTIGIGVARIFDTEESLLRRADTAFRQARLSSDRTATS